MAEEDGGQEKSHDPSARRLERAREEGDAPRSQDAQTVAAYAGFLAAALLAGPWAIGTVGTALTALLADPDRLATAVFGSATPALLPDLMAEVTLGTLPVLAAPAALVVAALIAQRGIRAVPSKIAPQLSRLSPIANAGQKYGLTGLVEFAKSVARLLAVAGVLWIVVAQHLGRIGTASAVPGRQVGSLLADLFAAMGVGLLAVATAVAAVDLVWQQVDFARRNRMTHQELKEEAKQSEGDPYMRAQRRERAREIANTRMLHDVPQADVVIVNPTHVAVALAWEKSRDRAPRCLAKGVDEIALRIREVAERAGVPVHRDAPTARSIHALVEVGQEVRPEHYRAVAAAILFAEEVRTRARTRWSAR